MMIPGIMAQRRHVSGGTGDPVALSMYNKIVGWWERDELSGTTMVDAHTNGLNGTYSGGVLGSTPIPSLGSAVNRTGAPAAYDEVLNNPLLDLPGNLTVSSWIFTGPAGQPSPNHNIFSKTDDVSATNFRLFRDINLGRPRFAVTIGGVAYTAAASMFTSTNQKVHLLGMRNGAEVAIYRDGSMAGSVAIPGGAVLDTTTSPLRAGNSGGMSGMQAHYDQSIVFNDALTADEIDMLYNSGNGITYLALKALAGI